VNLWHLSIKRPIFIVCVVFLVILIGLLSMSKLGVDNFPDVTFPVVTVQTTYVGAAPEEVETLISKPIEEEISSIGGIKRVSSNNTEGFSIVVAEFTLGTDVKYAEQQVRDKVAGVKNKLPNDLTRDPVIRRIDIADQPILRVSVYSATLTPAQLYDITENTIKPKIEQVDGVGVVDILGGTKREIRVEVDQRKLKNRELSIQQVAQRIASATQNVPVGSVTQGPLQTVFRTVGEYKTVQQIKDTAINFFGSDVPVTIGDIATVADTTEEEKTRGYLDSKPALFLDIKKASGTNTVQVADGILNAMDNLNKDLAAKKQDVRLTKVIDSARWIRMNLSDVKDSILGGIFLAVIVVFLFLGNFRSTIITGLALPNSLLGAFILMYLMGFTINVMTLLALSLAVGLLIDDAIVVRENIFRRLEAGDDPKVAAAEGTREVALAVVATTLTVIAVFLPVGFLTGTVGQFFKQFGLTIVFAMAISLFDALTMAPMLSAYFADVHKRVPQNPLRNHSKWYNRSSSRRIIFFPVLIAATVLHFFSQGAGRAARTVDRMQTALEHGYDWLIHATLRHRLRALIVAFLIFAGSLIISGQVKKTFIPNSDNGEFQVSMEMPPGTSLEKMADEVKKLEAILKQRKEFNVIASVVGNTTGEPNFSNTFVGLVNFKERKETTQELKAWTREALKPMAYALPKVTDRSIGGDNQRPFNLLIIGDDLDQLNDLAQKKIIPQMQTIPGLVDVDTNYRIGKPEFQVRIDPVRAQRLGVLSANAGLELRGLVEGIEAAKFRENGEEYNIRVRLREDQRDLKTRFNETWVPNMNFQLVKLSNIANPADVLSASMIPRLNRSRYLKISGDLGPGGALGNITEETRHILDTAHLPPGVSYSFLGQAEDFKDLIINMVIAAGLAIIFTYLILSSLYESFITPLTIMLALPLAMTGAFVALFLFKASLDLFSMIGCIMLLGLVTKNSILLVDLTLQLMNQGIPRNEAIRQAGIKRLRPILMTTLALIAGMLPIALGFSEISRSRKSMGIAIIGGLLSSTFLTLVVVPAAFGYIDDFKNFVGRIAGKVMSKPGAKKASDTQDGKRAERQQFLQM